MKELEKPEWLKVRAWSGDEFQRMRQLGKDRGLHTVCDASQCPNISECWSRRNVTFLLLGEICTRHCGFCAVKNGDPKGIVDWEEPEKIAAVVKEMGLCHVVITSVTRDDLPDGGARQFSDAIEAIKRSSPETSVEVLVPDFQGNEESIERVVDAGPEVLAHNIETVKSLQGKVRDQRSSYETSLKVLRIAKEINPRIATKSSIMLGMGESRVEILNLMADLRASGVDLLTLGQYLRPRRGIPVRRYLHPDDFDELREVALRLGFKFVASHPFVRSSYMAHEAYLAFKKR
jgi:lipoic acid synthetase